mgnify:FL=1
MAAKEGYVCEVDPECEFFLFHTDDNGVPTTLTHEKAGYLDISRWIWEKMQDVIWF